MTVALPMETGFLAWNGLSVIWSAGPETRISACRLTHSGRMSSMWLTRHTEPNSKQLSGLPV